MDYEETLEDIEETLGMVPGFMETLPEDVLIQEWPLFKKYKYEESEIPAKYRELIGLAVAANIKCPYCELSHRESAKTNGATADELAETVFLASDTAKWSAIIHAQRYDFDLFKEEFEQVEEYLQENMEKQKSCI